MNYKLAIEGGTPASDHLIGYGHQLISKNDVDNVISVLNSDYLTCGPMTTAFERKLENIVGAPCIAVSNGTAALHVACLSADIGVGDEVIVSPLTFAASANCILYCGGTPVFADIDPDTWNISPEAIKSKVTDKTKAIIGVDFGGVPVDVDAISDICNENDLVFIEDAAHSIGSKYHGRPIGSVADLTTFSFHPVKTVTTGEGGAVACTAPKLLRQATLFAKHGITRDGNLFVEEDEGGWYYEQIELGYNYRMSDIQAALGSSQLDKLDTFKARRQEIVHIYDEAFSRIHEVKCQHDPDPQQTVRHLYCLEFDTEVLCVDRKSIYNALRAENIGVNVHYKPVYLLPYYKNLGYVKGECPNAEQYYERAITIPLHAAMTDDEISSVIHAVEKVVTHFRSLR